MQRSPAQMLPRGSSAVGAYLGSFVQNDVHINRWVALKHLQIVGEISL